MILNDPTSATPTFVAPDVTRDTTLTFTLVATDSLGMASAPATVAVTVQRALQTPHADAGTAVVVTSGAEVTLDGTKSTVVTNADGVASTPATVSVFVTKSVASGDGCRASGHGASTLLSLGLIALLRLRASRSTSGSGTSAWRNARSQKSKVPPRPTTKPPSNALARCA